MPKVTFKCVILFSFIYLCSTLFQSFFELDSFSASVSNLPWASTPQRKGCEAGWGFLADSSWHSLNRREMAHEILVPQLTPHTATWSLPAAVRTTEICYETHFLSPLRTPDFWTVQRSPPDGTDQKACSVPALVSPGFDLSSFQMGRGVQPSCDQGGGGTKPTHTFCDRHWKHRKPFVFSYAILYT